MFPLHKAPGGLLELLRLRTLGAQPNGFSEQVTGVIECTPFYSLDVQFGAQTANAAAAYPLGVAETLQAGPIQIRALSMQIAQGAAAGTFVHWRIGLLIPTGSNTGAVVALTNLLSGQATPRANTTLFLGGVLPEPVMAPIGAQIIWSAISDAAGADHVLQVNAIFANLSGQR